MLLFRKGDSYLAYQEIVNATYSQLILLFYHSLVEHFYI
nr:MAG TPA: hypothetical protein [Bacteriophage sp.]